MKRRAVVCAVLLALAVSACARQEPPSDSITALDAGAWPDNEYTEGLPVPPGAVAWAMLDTERQYCSVHLTNVSESDCAAYMEAVQEAGFSVVEHAAEELEGARYESAGTLLSDGARWMSISRLPDSLTLYLSPGAS